jgi:hypothetical protein
MIVGVVPPRSSRFAFGIAHVKSAMVRIGSPRLV